MWAVTCGAPAAPRFGQPDVLTWVQVPDPRPRAGEVVVAVDAAGINRADLLQRAGHYPPPPGASDIPGLECAGQIAELGPDVEGWAVGDAVCALLTGGGYAERVAVPAGQLLPIPRGLSAVEAAALPEAACTVWSNVFDHAGLREGETLLVHGGTSGIGSFAIQLARAHGARVLATSGSAAKCDAARRLGADVAINYRETDFVDAARDATDGRGVDVILDVVGAKYLGRNVEALATGGRLVIIGFQGGRKGELDLAALAARRASVTATTLRSRPAAEKGAIVSAVREHVWPLVESGAVRPVVDAAYPMPEAATAHRRLEEGTDAGVVGKLVLTVPA